MRRLALAALLAALAAPATGQQKAHVEVAFTPGDDISALIVKRISQARSNVKMQAFLFTDRRVANALLAARKRGVEVEIIGDGAQEAGGGLPHLAALHRAGARVWIDTAHAAAHDKVVIVDGADARAVVITGSYNFTHSAQSRNAENVVVLSGNRAVTDRFVENFEKHRRESRPWR